MQFKNLTILDHPLIQQKLFYLRDRHTNNYNFRTILNELAGLMVYEITRDFPLIEREVSTPLEKTTGYVLAKPITLVPILRAGLGMCDGIMNLVPQARVGHLGLYRDKKTLQPVEYYHKFPSDLADSEVLVIDPMLATGGSAVAALDFVKKAGATSIAFICLVAAPEGVRFLEERYPDIPVYTAALDRKLNDHKYILPGLGDAGDRIYGTE
ncbi:MAG TPA: uracil phosphoribosyltransferase [Calditrichaeota bacterium]|nr:uracil phosphoribosyltransferase [Calditrichota bacterium]